MAEGFVARVRNLGWITAVVMAFATAVMAAVAVIAYVRPPDSGGRTEQVADPTAAATASRTPGGPGPTGGPGTIVGDGASEETDLAGLTLISGALAELPAELADEPGYERAVVIACPTNETGRRINEIVFETRYLYSTLNADLHAYRDPPDSVLANLWLFSDPQDRDPGAPPPGQTHFEQLRMGATRELRGIEIGESYYLRLRVECEKPGGFVVLTGAALHPDS